MDYEKKAKQVADAWNNQNAHESNRPVQDAEPPKKEDYDSVDRWRNALYNYCVKELTAKNGKRPTESEATKMYDELWRKLK